MGNETVMDSKINYEVLVKNIANVIEGASTDETQDNYMTDGEILDSIIDTFARANRPINLQV